MAFATQPDRTILVVLGNQELASDLAGRHYVHLDGTPEKLHQLAGRLEAAGCPTRTTGSQWLDVARFPDRADTAARPTPEPSAVAVSPDEALRDKLSRVLQDLVATTAAALDVAPRDLGAHVWRPTESDQLERIARLRVGDTPPNRPRLWRHGVGVVGWSWATGEYVYLDLERQELRGIDQAAFRSLPEDLRMGLELAELQRAQLDFRAIWAAPVYRKEAIIAVVSLNLDSNRNGDVEARAVAEIGDALRSATAKIELALP
jgi:hypothetical protein